MGELGWTPVRVRDLTRGGYKEQVRGYKLFVNRTNEKDDRKDIQYFDYVRKSGEKYDEARIHERLYKGSDKNTF